jgi:hypothetical protein
VKIDVRYLPSVVAELGVARERVDVVPENLEELLVRDDRGS